MSSLQGPMQLLIHNAKQIVTVSKNGELFLKGDRMRPHILNRKPDDGLSILVDKKGNIAAVGFDSEIGSKCQNITIEKRIDASDLCITPGFIDAHTHPVWAGDRVHEFRMKLAGKSYMEIHNAGGGILLTVEHTRKASEEELYRNLKDRLLRMLRSGTTTVECKSGYGLDTESEMKLLRVLNRAKHEIELLDISITFLGAHAIPNGKDEESATREIIEEQLPEIAKAIRLGEISVDSCDVFCERSVFGVENAKKILEAGRIMGLRLNFHADQIVPIGGSTMGAEIKAEVMSHLENVTDETIEKMAQNDTFGVMLPTAAYVLKLEPPPVRKMINAGVPIALGSDFGPNAFCLSMPTVMNLGCILFGMSLEEALVSSTLNAAASLGLSKTHGSIEIGKKADFVLLDVPTWEHLIYQFGEHEKLIQMVIKNGFVAYNNDRSRQ